LARPRAIAPRAAPYRLKFGAVAVVPSEIEGSDSPAAALPPPSRPRLKVECGRPAREPQRCRDPTVAGLLARALRENHSCQKCH